MDGSEEVESQAQEGELHCFLADLLYSSGLSLRAAAERVGKARTTLIRWRDNTAEEFEFETLARLCSLFVFSVPHSQHAPSKSIPISLLLEYSPQMQSQHARSIPVVQALPTLPPHCGRHQIICTLGTRLAEEGLSYEELARQLGQNSSIQAETVSNLVRGKTGAISRRTLTLLCQRYRSIENIFQFDPHASIVQP